MLRNKRRQNHIEIKILTTVLVIKCTTALEELKSMKFTKISCFWHVELMIKDVKKRNSNSD